MLAKLFKRFYPLFIARIQSYLLICDVIKCWDYPKEMAIVKQFLVPIKFRMKVFMNDFQ